jgi:hypothetical protein
VSVQLAMLATRCPVTARTRALAPRADGVRPTSRRPALAAPQTLSRLQGRVQRHRGSLHTRNSVRPHVIRAVAAEQASSAALPASYQDGASQPMHRAAVQTLGMQTAV